MGLGGVGGGGMSHAGGGVGCVMQIGVGQCGLGQGGVQWGGSCGVGWVKVEWWGGGWLS